MWIWVLLHCRAVTHAHSGQPLPGMCDVFILASARFVSTRPRGYRQPDLYYRPIWTGRVSAKQVDSTGSTGSPF
ncbi:hypothetical protein BDV09DRAFT_175450 [Aspergillus tetrazonus]